MSFNNDFDPLHSQRDAADFIRTMGHLRNQDAQRKLLEEQVRLQKEALELEKKKLEQEQEKLKQEREKLEQQKRESSRSVPRNTEPEPQQTPEGFDWLYDQIAIKNEPDPYRKMQMLREYEAKHGKIEPRERIRLGIPGY